MTVRYSDDAQASRFAAQAYAALVLARQQKAPLGALREIDGRIDRRVFDVLSVDASVASRTSFGGTAPERVRAAIGPARNATNAIGPVVAVAGGAAFTFGYPEHAELLHRPPRARRIHAPQHRESGHPALAERRDHELAVELDGRPAARRPVGTAQ